MRGGPFSSRVSWQQLLQERLMEALELVVQQILERFIVPVTVSV